MTHSFHIAHATHGRTRIRWAGDPGDRALIGDIAQQIAELEGVDQAIPRITTGSIIIEHEQAEWPTIKHRLANVLKVEIISPTTERTQSGLEILNHGLARVDDSLKDMNTDLRAVTVLMLSALAITQAFRGQVMVSSASLLWYAFSIATKSHTPGDSAESSTPVDIEVDAGE